MLDNGMRAILIENNRAPVVTHMVWYHVGAADEPKQQSGLAHYLEHLMFKGSKTIPPGEFSKTIKRLGGRDNAFTSQDYTAYFQTIASANLATVMKMEAERMLSMQAPEKEALSELNVVLEERRQRMENNPQAQFFAALRNALFAEHPYGTPIIGWPEDVQDLNLDKAKAFHKNWYTPSNATLVVAGNVTLKDFKKLAQDIYGALPKMPAPTRQDHNIIPALTQSRLIKMGHPLIRQPLYTIMYRTPSWASNTSESLALQVLEEYLDGSEASPLYQELVVNQKLATSISLSYDPFSLGPSALSITAYPAKGVSFETLSNALKAFLRSLDIKNLPTAQIQTVKTRLQDSAIFARDSITGPAMLVGRALGANIPLKEIEAWPTLIENVSLEDISFALNRYVSGPNTLVIEGYLSPSKEDTVHERL